jgi:hypothetical protein
MTYHAPANRVLRIGTSGQLDDALEAALEVCAGKYQAGASRHSTTDFNRRSVHTTRCNSLLQFLAMRPDVIVADSSAPSALQAIAFRSTYRKSRLLLWVATEERVKTLRWITAMNVDGVLAPASVAPSITSLGTSFPQVFPMPESFDIDEFMSCPVPRSHGPTHRLVCYGDLTPESGVLEFLLCASLWAEQNPTGQAEILWIGKGDLLGVIKAQPTPDNLKQCFLDQISRSELASLLAETGFLVVPTLQGALESPVAEAMAAGVLIIGSAHDPVVQKIVQHEENGWLFDPYSPADLLGALNIAFGAPQALLDKMRVSARTTVASMSRHNFAESLSFAIATVLRDGRLSDHAAVAAP